MKRTSWTQPDSINGKVQGGSWFVWPCEPWIETSLNFPGSCPSLLLWCTSQTVSAKGNRKELLRNWETAISSRLYYWLVTVLSCIWVNLTLAAFPSLHLETMTVIDWLSGCFCLSWRVHLGFVCPPGHLLTILICLSKLSVTVYPTPTLPYLAIRHPGNAVQLALAGSGAVSPRTADETRGNDVHALLLIQRNSLEGYSLKAKFS